MLLIFAGTILLVGPAWCSFLCYFGAFDSLASCKKGTPGIMPKWRSAMQIGIAAAVIAAALLFRHIGVRPVYAAYAAGAFMVVGIAVIIFWSLKTGVMTHCTSYCPIGFIATRLGKLNPFRIRINDDCDACGDCTSLCRYDALSMSDVKRKKPGGSCTLCGDCVSACAKESIGFRLPLLSPKQARILFIVMVVSLHAIFLGLARV
jgi:polyferredoxin